MDLDSRYPGVLDIKWAARRRLPKFVWEYLDSGTGVEATKALNRTRLDAIGFLPSILHGEVTSDVSTTFLGQTYDAPFGIAPVGMSGLIWPDAEGHLARAGRDKGMPYCLSTVASQTPEDLAEHLGDRAWFQLYPPRDEDIRRHMLGRARDAGIKTLVLTADVPVASRRERQTRSGLIQPPRLTPRLMAQVAIRPAWAWGMARQGMPRMRMLDAYSGGAYKDMSPTAHIGYLLRTSPDLDYVHWLRDAWEGHLIVKGMLRPEDCLQMEQAGVDALWVSNHAGRQFDGAPAAIDMLPLIRTETRLPLVFDSGIEGGLDILRAIAMGADFVMMGRAWHFALGALGGIGPGYMYEMLCKDMLSNMGQMGAASLADLPAPVYLDRAGPRIFENRGSPDVLD